MKPSEKKLIEDYFAQSISEEDISSLNELLLNSEEARSFYLTYASVMENLDESRQAHNLHNFGQSKTTRFPRKKGGKWLAIAASIIFAVFLLNHFVFQKTVETDHGIAVNSENPPKIQLIDFFGLDETHHLFVPGQTRFEPGEYKTASGKLHLRFGESVDVIFTGSSIFQILSEKEIFVQQGNIRTIVHDARGHEFTIRTPSAHYIDWGTEFCLNIQPNSTDQFEVDEGLVEVKDIKGGNSFGKFKPYNNPEPKNAPFTLIDLSNDLPGEAGFARWTDLVEKKSKDPDLLGLYTFENPNKNQVNLSSETFLHNLPKTIPAKFETDNPKDVILNRAKSGIASHGIQRSCSRSYGRWQGGSSKSLKFNNRWSAAYFELPGKHEEFTFQTWLQMHQSKSSNNMLLKPLLWDTAGRMCIRTDRRGKPFQSIWGELNLRENRNTSQKVVNDWQLLTYTFGKENGRVVSKLYLNKNLITTAFPKYAKDIQMNGFLWGASRNGQTGKIGSNFDGRIDELSLWAKALSEKDIEAEYHQGYPFYLSFSPELVQK
jgi:hypothetical protein